MEHEYELREYGKRLMEELYREYIEAVEDGGPGADPYDNSIDVLDGMNNVEVLAVMYVTATEGEAFESVREEIAECVRNHSWAWQ